MALFRRSDDGNSEPHRVPIALDSFKLRRVCKVCNNGWMSHLENEAKPLILSLMTRARTIDSLDRGQRHLLARWAAKTAIIESHAVGAESPVDSRLLGWMKENEDGPPGRFAAVAAASEFSGVGHIQVGIITDLVGGRDKIAANIAVLVFSKPRPDLRIPMAKC